MRPYSEADIRVESGPDGAVVIKRAELRAYQELRRLVQDDNMYDAAQLVDTMHRLGWEGW